MEAELIYRMAVMEVSMGVTRAWKYNGGAKVKSMAHQTWKRMSNPMYQPSLPKEYPSPEACYSHIPNSSIGRNNSIGWKTTKI